MNGTPGPAPFPGLASAAGGLAAPLASVAAAMLASGAVMALAGIDPLSAYAALFRSVAGSPAGVGMAVAKAAPLMLAGLGIAFAFRCGLVNTGGEGQIYIGALFATLVGLAGGGLPAVLHLPLAVLAGFAGGAVWGAVAGWLRARRGLNEIITTIMLNYIAFWFVSYLVHGPLKDPQGFGYPQTAEVAAAARLPVLSASARIDLGIVLSLAAALAVHVLLWRTVMGFEIRTVGGSPSTAGFMGIDVARRTIQAMAVGGGLAGLAGTVELLGTQHRLSDFFSPGYGYDAIAVALLGRNSPAGVAVAAFLFGALRSGAESLQRSAGVPEAVAGILQGMITLFIVASTSLAVIRRLRQAPDRRKDG